MTKPHGKIHLIDDDSAIYEPLRRRLEEDGWEVAVSASGDAALDDVASSRPDLAVIDLVLPGRSGLEILRDMREDERLREQPAVVLSSLPKARHWEELHGLGALDYLNKIDMEVEEIVGRIEELASEARQ